jgi:hypothetical protein
MSDLATHRLDQFEKRADATDRRLERIETLLTDIRLDLARKPSTAALWGMMSAVSGAAAATIWAFVFVLVV